MNKIKLLIMATLMSHYLYPMQGDATLGKFEQMVVSNNNHILEKRILSKKERERNEALGNMVGLCFALIDMIHLASTNEIQDIKSCLVVTEDGTKETLFNMISFCSSHRRARKYEEILGGGFKKNAFQGYINFFHAQKGLVLSAEGKNGKLPVALLSSVDRNATQDPLSSFYHQEFDRLDKTMNERVNITPNNLAFLFGKALAIQFVSLLCNESNGYFGGPNSKGLIVFPDKKSRALISHCLMYINTEYDKFENKYGKDAPKTIFCGFIEYLMNASLLLSDNSKIGYVPIPQLGIKDRSFYEEKLGRLQVSMLKKISD